MKRLLSKSLVAAAISLAIAPTVWSGNQPAAHAANRVSFEKPIALRGTLGDAQVQVTLRSKEPKEDGIEGEYFVFGLSRNVLLAGEVEGEDLFMEESENGTDVSGQWEGKLTADAVNGEWQSADGKVKKPFNLRIVRVDDRLKPAQNGKAASQNKQQ